MQRLQLGIELATREGRAAGATASWADIRAMAKLAEEVGFDTLFLEDHLLYRHMPGRELGPAPGESVGFWECWTLIAPLAEATSRVTIGPLVAATSYRNPALIAKMAATLDDMCDGRFLLGLGAGWHEPEYAAFGFEFDHLASRFEEALQIIVPLLKTGHVDFQGKYYTARDCELRPRGPTPGGPPLWIGARQPRMLRIIARYADAYNTYGHITLATVAERHANLEAACRDVGRDPATILKSHTAIIALPGPDGDRSGCRDAAVTGTPEEIAAQVLPFRSLGVQHLSFLVDPGDIRGIERCAPMIEALRKLEAAG